MPTVNMISVIYKSAVIVGTVLLVCGCSGRRADTQALKTRASANIKDGTVRTYQRTGEYQQVDDLSPHRRFESGNADTKQRARLLTDTVANIDEIHRASVVITGNIAIVGIELKDELTSAQMVKCKNEVEKKVKAVDEEIDHVAVTAEAELVQRVTNLVDNGYS